MPFMLIAIIEQTNNDILGIITPKYIHANIIAAYITNITSTNAAKKHKQYKINSGLLFFIPNIPLYFLPLQLLNSPFRHNHKNYLIYLDQYYYKSRL